MSEIIKTEEHKRKDLQYGPRDWCREHKRIDTI